MTVGGAKVGVAGGDVTVGGTGAGVAGGDVSVGDAGVGGAAETQAEKIARLITNSVRFAVSRAILRDMNLPT